MCQTNLFEKTQSGMEWSRKGKGRDEGWRTADGVAENPPLVGLLLRSLRRLFILRARIARMQKEMLDMTRTACWTMARPPIWPFLPAAYQNVEHRHNIAPDTVIVETVSTAPSRRPQPRTTPICPIKFSSSLSVPPALAFRTHNRRILSCRWGLLRSEKFGSCEVRLLDNKSRITVSFENEAFLGRHRPAFRSRTDPKLPFCMLGFYTSVLKIIGALKSSFDESTIISVKICRCARIPQLRMERTPIALFDDIKRNSRNPELRIHLILPLLAVPSA